MVRFCTIKMTINVMLHSIHINLESIERCHIIRIYSYRSTKTARVDYLALPIVFLSTSTEEIP